MSSLLAGALQLVLPFLAIPVHAYVPVEREPEPPLARSSPLPVDAALRAICGGRTQATWPGPSDYR